MSRGFLTALAAACVAFAPCAMVQILTPGAAHAESSVKSSKSNTSDRMGGGGGGGPKATRTTTVKSSKSNTSDRMGGGGGGGGPAKAINLNSSKSNKY